MRKYIIIGGVILIIALGVVVAVTTKKSSNTNIDTNSNGGTSANNTPIPLKDQPDVREGAPLEAPSTELRSDRLQTDPWSKDLPYFTEYYDIYFSGHNSVTIDVPNINPAAENRYKQEALDWLKTQGAPIDQLNVTLE